MCQVSFHVCNFAPGPLYFYYVIISLFNFFCWGSFDILELTIVVSVSMATFYYESMLTISWGLEPYFFRKKRICWLHIFHYFSKEYSERNYSLLLASLDWSSLLHMDLKTQVAIKHRNAKTQEIEMIIMILILAKYFYFNC